LSINSVFKGTKENVFKTIHDLAYKYGPIFTIWAGNNPMVVISDLEIVKQAFNSKNNEFNGRPETVFNDMITQGKGNDVVFTNHGPIWASLRRVAHSAVRYLRFRDFLNCICLELLFS